MTSLRDIRHRLRSVENIKKITDTMERVAAARLRQAQAKAEQSRPYISKMKDILENVASTDVSHPLFEQREVKKTGLIIISADRGLSGSYNTNIFLAADRFLKNYHPDQIELIILGRKGIDHYSRRHWKVRHRLTEWIEKNNFQEIKLFSDQLVDWFLSGEFDEIWLIYTHYISVMHRNVIVEKFLNIGKPQLEKTKKNKNLITTDNVKKNALNYIFEPSPEEILNEILPRYCITRIQTALYESYASELGARIIAMQTASRNSEEMITNLTLMRNKTRQQDITREMIEIVSGAVGLK